MESYPFELGPIRPVDEGDSLLIRTTRGCPWNKCEFCVNYKGMRFSMRPVERNLGSGNCNKVFLSPFFLQVHF
jgi:radical SAM superfamily enzyme YgiQ (UPF0313 family)